MTHTGVVRRAAVYGDPQPDHVEIHYTDVPPPRVAQHLLLVLVDDAPFTTLYQPRNAIPVAPAPGPPYTPSSGLLPSTPTLESLAANGIRFKSCRVYAECSPTRVSIGTGKYGFRTGVANVINLNATQAGDLGEFGDPGFVHRTLFQALGDVGVRQAMIGKLHVSADYNQNYNGRDGLGWQIIERWCHSSTYTATTLRNLNQTAGDYIQTGNVGDGSYYYFPINYGRANGFETLVDGQYNTTVLTDAAISWWSTADNSVPNFMWLAYNATHTPLGSTAPETKRDFPPADLVNTQEYTDAADAEATGSLHSFAEDQFAAMEAIDTELGRLLASIPSEVRERLTVVYMSDNGIDSISVPGWRNGTERAGYSWNKDFGADWNFIIDSVDPDSGYEPRMKGSLYHFGTCVECVWSGPGLYTKEQLRKGQMVDFAVDAPDIGQTIAEYFDTTLAPCDGVSAFDAIYTDPSVNYQTHARQFQFSETFNPNGDWNDLMSGPGANQELRQAMWGWYHTSLDGIAPAGRYHLIRVRESGAWTYRLFRHYDEFYVDVDPFERTDISADATYAAVKADLEARIEALLSSGTTTGNAISVTLEDGVSTKLILTADYNGEDSIPVLSDDGATTLYVLPGTSGSVVGMPVAQSSGRVVPYVDTSTATGWALAIDNAELGPSTAIKVIPCDQNDALPVGNSTGRVIPSTPGAPNTIPVGESGGMVLSLVAYP